MASPSGAWKSSPSAAQSVTVSPLVWYSCSVPSATGEFPNVCSPGYWGPILLTSSLLFVDFVFFKPGKITYQYVLISKNHRTFTKLNHCFQSALEFSFKAQKASPKAAWIQWRNWGWLPWGLLAGGNSVTVEHGAMKHNKGLHAKSSAKAFFSSPCEILVLLGENQEENFEIKWMRIW